MLDVSTVCLCCTWACLKRLVLHLDMSTSQSPKLHWTCLQQPVLHQDVSTPQKPELQLEVSGQWTAGAFAASGRGA
jgi:hypothetical protein